MGCSGLKLVFSVWFLSLVVGSSCAGDGFKLLYRGVLAQTVENTSASDSDIREALNLAVKNAKLAGAEYSLSSFEKQRLYFTTDGITPYLQERYSTARNGQVSVQKIQTVIGLLYTFVMHPNSTGEEGARYYFTVTRDRNKEFHILKKTSPLNHTLLDKERSETEDVSWCGNEETFFPWLRFLPPQTHKYLTPLLLPLHLLRPLTSSSAQSLRVASYNIWNVNDLRDKGENYQDRLRRFGKLISSLQVDVFGFQEVRLEVANPPKPKKQKQRKKKHQKSTESQVTQLAHHLPHHQFVFQPAMFLWERLLERKEEGLAIFSRYPIISSDYRLLFKNDSDEEDGHQRICLHAELHVPQFGQVHVFVSHLSLSAKVQERSVVEIWQYMQEFTGVKILMGDMNAEPDSNAIRFLRGDTSLEGVWTSNLYDTWSLPFSNKDLPGLTFNALDEKPVKRIDYIFASITSKFQVSSSEVILDEDICFLPCSDHHPVMAVLNPPTF